MSPWRSPATPGPGGDERHSLDVTIQAQFLSDRQAQHKMGTAVFLITTYGVFAGMCDQVCVMYAGRL
jgi:oligopeptide transport system ATP-binding protein